MHQDRALLTRQAVLLAAARVFERKGFAGATIAEILDEGHLTKGAMYFHFDSKESLARAVIEGQWQWISYNAAEASSPVQGLVDLSFRFVQALQTDPLVRASIRLTLEQNTFGAQDPSPYVAWVSVITGLLEDAQASGQLLTHIRPEDAAHLLASAVTGTQLTSEALTQRSDLQDRIKHLWVVLLPGLMKSDHISSIDLNRISH